MFSFFKKNRFKGQLNVLPKWASFFTPSEYSEFIKYVENYFQKLSLDYEIDDAAVTVGENNLGFNILGLNNVAQMCKQNDLKDYESVVNDHFDTMIRIHQFDQEFEKSIPYFEKVEKYIAVRLYDSGYASYLEEENLVIQDFAEDIIAMLVFDLPESVINIKPEQVQFWGKTIEELFVLGRKNIKENYPVNLSEEIVGEHSIWFAEADHFFASSFTFDIAEYPQTIGKKGSIVSIPNRHTVIIYPINDLEVLGAVSDILYLTKRMHEDGPGSITDKIYWYNDGKFINLPHKTENEKLIFSPPQIFVDILNALSQKKKTNS